MFFFHCHNELRNLTFIMSMHRESLTESERKIKNSMWFIISFENHTGRSFPTENR